MTLLLIYIDPTTHNFWLRPWWEYQLLNDIEISLDLAVYTKDPQIFCRLSVEQIVLSCETMFYNTDEAHNLDFARKYSSIDPTTKFRIPHYFRETNYDRDTIRGSVYGQMRKIENLKLFQANFHSPIFVDNNPFGGLFDGIIQYMK